MIFAHFCRKWASSSHVNSRKTFCLYKVLLSDSLKSKNYEPDSRLFRAKQPENLRLQNSIKNYVIAVGVLGLGLTFAAVPLYRIFCQATGFGGTSRTDIGGEKIEKLKKVPYRQIKVKFTSDVGTNLQWEFKPQQNEITKYVMFSSFLDHPFIRVREAVKAFWLGQFHLIDSRLSRFYQAGSAKALATLPHIYIGLPYPDSDIQNIIPGETALAFYTATNPLDKPVIGISSYNILPYEAAIYFNKIQCFCFEEQMLNPKEQVDMPVFFYVDPEFCEDPLMENVDEIVLSYTFFAAKEPMSLKNLFNRSV